jgi:hypothetical protein
MKIPPFIMEERAQAYNDVAKIEEGINELCSKKEIEKYPNYWIVFCRTLKTGLDIIEAIAMEELKK